MRPMDMSIEGVKTKYEYIGFDYTKITYPLPCNN
jgi:hypothetical protein